MNRLLAALLPLSLLMTTVGADPAHAQDAGKPMVVVELFTSQGCSSCPPADAFLGDLARRDDVVALGYHVDYWNRLGWVDPFSGAWTTALQSAYSRSQHRNTNYTPQMIIDGRVDAVGSRRSLVEQLITDQQKRSGGPQAQVTLEPADNGEVQVRLDGHSRQPVEAEVILLRYDREHTTPVGRGENYGRTLENFNVVRERRILGRWRGEPASFTVPASTDPAQSGLAVLVQERNQGAILGANRLQGW